MNGQNQGPRGNSLVCFPDGPGQPYLEELKHVVLHIEFVHASEKDLPVGIVDVFHDEAVVCVGGVSHDVQERNDVGTSGDVSQHLDLLMHVKVAGGNEWKGEFAPPA